MERRAAARPDTPLFIRPIYRSVTWVPDELDYGLLVDGRLQCERFTNGPGPGRHGAQPAGPGM
jgi:hypothetical protein